MAKADQEAHFGIRLQSVRKALPEGQSQETHVLPDRQAGLSADRQNNTLDFGEERDRGEKKRAVNFMHVVYSSPQPQPTDAQWPRLTRLDPSTRDLVGWEVSANTSIHVPQKQVFDSLWRKEVASLHTGAEIVKSDERAETGITKLHDEKR